MSHVREFAVETWMDKYETTPNVLNISETCAASVSINDLIALSENKNAPHPLDSAMTLTYGPIRGSDKLRQRLAALYSVRTPTPLPYENILTTAGAIQANFLVLYKLLTRGDHVICMYPTYQQLYSIPESLGCEVSLWKLKEGKGWQPNVDQLQDLVKSNTKMIIINNPNNPTGAVIPKSTLKAIIEFAREKGVTVLSDEVYRPLFHGIGPGDDEYPPSMLNLGYDNVIVTGSMSKAYSLAGIRLGWVASRSRDLVEAISSARDYATISVSQLDDAVAAYALGPDVLHSLLARNIQLAKTNVDILEKFIDRFDDYVSWTKPKAGSTAFIKFSRDGEAVDDVALCRHVLKKVNVMLVPGSRCFGKYTHAEGENFKGYVRLGYVCHTAVLEEALEKLGQYLKTEFKSLEDFGKLNLEEQEP